LLVEDVAKGAELPEREIERAHAARQRGTVQVHHVLEQRDGFVDPIGRRGAYHLLSFGVRSVNPHDDTESEANVKCPRAIAPGLDNRPVRPIVNGARSVSWFVPGRACVARRGLA
jgi:hypothetical protein